MAAEFCKQLDFHCFHPRDTEQWAHERWLEHTIGNVKYMYMST